MLEIVVLSSIIIIMVVYFQHSEYYSSLFFFLDLVYLSRISLCLYYDFAQLTDDAYCVLMDLVLILHFCTFFVQIRVLVIVVDDEICVG